MLKKLHRITKKSDFDKFFGANFKKAKGFSASSNCLILKSLNNDLKISRFAFVISTKIDKRATKRNLVKRRLREIIRLNLKNMKSGYDILIIAKKGIVEKSYQELEKELSYLLKRIKFFEKHG